MFRRNITRENRVESENDLQDSVSYELNLTIRNLKGVIEIIDEKLEDYK